jgi:hypothetical protein
LFVVVPRWWVAEFILVWVRIRGTGEATLPPSKNVGVSTVLIPTDDGEREENTGSKMHEVQSTWFFHEFQKK